MTDCVGERDVFTFNLKSTSLEKMWMSNDHGMIASGQFLCFQTVQSQNIPGKTVKSSMIELPLNMPRFSSSSGDRSEQGSWSQNSYCSG